MKNNGYNGYTNWETWMTMLWHEQDFRDAVEQYTEEIEELMEKKGRWAAIGFIKNLIREDTESFYEQQTPPWDGLMQEFARMGFSLIDWVDIAAHIIDEMDEWEEMDTK